MTAPETKWTAIAPGVMMLPTTKYVIKCNSNKGIPFQVFWDERPIYGSFFGTLEAAQAGAEEHMSEHFTMGIEP